MAITMLIIIVSSRPLLTSEELMMVGEILAPKGCL